MSAEVPTCCGELMIEDNGIGWECADAYFSLLDDGVVDPCGFSPPRLTPRATQAQRALLAHLIETRIVMPDGS